MRKNKFWLLFGLIMILATFVRFYGVTQFPPSPYWEEVALGYDAYSILKTGRDHHNNPLPLVAFESFGDWKPSLYFYTLVPFIAVFGLNTLAVRLPAMLSGLTIVVGVGILARYLKSKPTNQDQLQLMAMAVTAVAPWAIQFSRAGWEANLATALILWGIVCFLQALKHQQKQLLYLLLGAGLLALSMYAYHAARIIAPLLGLGLGMTWLKLDESWSRLVWPGLLALLIAGPILMALGRNTTNQRFAETSLFSDLSVIELSNQRQEQAGHTWMSRIVYHRYLLYGREVFNHFLDHFELDFLFVSGDRNPRHSVQYVGTFYHFEAILLLLGFYALFKHQAEYRYFLIWWLVWGIFPAALTKTTPHALRILPTLPVWMILITLGIKEGFNLLKRYQKLLVLVIVLLYAIELTMFWRFYARIYPVKYADEWQFGYQAMIEDIAAYRQAHPDKIIQVSRDKGRPAMYYWFYTQTDPHEVQAANESVEKDQGEFLEFKNLRFE